MLLRVPADPPRAADNEGNAEASFVDAALAAAQHSTGEMSGLSCLREYVLFFALRHYNAAVVACEDDEDVVEQAFFL